MIVLIPIEPNLAAPSSGGSSLLTSDDGAASAKLVQGPRSEKPQMVVAHSARQAVEAIILPDGEPVSVLVDFRVGASGCLEMFPQDARREPHHHLRFLHPADRLVHVAQESESRLALPQHLLDEDAVGDVVMGDDGADAFRPREAVDSHREPASAGRRMTGILVGEFRDAAFQYRADAVGDRAVFDTSLLGRDAGFRVVPADGILIALQTIIFGESLPGLVDVQDYALGVKYGDVGGEGIERLVE